MPYSDKIPTATPMFSGSSFLMVVHVFPISWDVDVCYTNPNKMVDKLPQVLITLLVLLQIHMSFQKQYMGL